MKMGNNNLSFLQKLAEAADGAKEKTDFSDHILHIVSSPQKTLKDVFAQFDAPPTEDLGDPGMGDAGLDAGLDADLEPEGGDDVETAKKSLCDALVALCGSPEEAHNCIDQHCGGGEEAPPDLSAPPEVEPEPMPMGGPM